MCSQSAQFSSGRNFKTVIMSINSLKRVFWILMLSPFDRLEVNAFLHHFPEWRHFPQALNVRYHLLNRILDFLFCRKSSNSKSKLN